MHNTPSLTSLSTGLARDAFGTHLALNSYSLASRRRGGSLRLFRLLLALGRRLLLFPLTDSLEAGFGSLTCALAAALFDDV